MGSQRVRLDWATFTHTHSSNSFLLPEVLLPTQKIHVWRLSSLKSYVLPQLVIATTLVAGMRSVSSHRILLSYLHHARELEFCSSHNCFSALSRSDNWPCCFCSFWTSSSQIRVIAFILPSKTPHLKPRELLLLSLKWNSVKPPPSEFGRSVLVAQSCPILCDPMECSPPGSSVLGILQARILEWVAIPFSRESSWPRDWTWVSCIAGRSFTVWATQEAV